MFSKLRTLLLAGAAVAFAGCLEQKQEVTLNPDGTGKVVVEIKQPIDIMGGMNFGGEPAAKKSPQAKVKEEVAKILKDTKGVEAWEDVSFMVEEDETNYRFKGTAYFKSYNDVAIGGGLKSEKNSKVEVNDKGISVFWEKPKKNMGMPATKAKPKPVKLSDAEVAKRVKKAQAQMKQTAAMMGPMLGGFKEEVIFHLPGKIDKVNNFKKKDDNTVFISFTGEKLMKIMNDFANDNKALEAAVKAGRNLQKDGPGDEYMNKKMFGSNGKIMAHSPKGKPQFDYKKAVGKAKKNFPAMCKKLGVDVK